MSTYNIQRQNLLAVLRGLASQYPNDMVTGQIRDVPRIAFNILLSFNSVLPKAFQQIEICDLGGGIGLFSIACASYNLNRVVLVDDFNDKINRLVGDSVLNLHRKFGVEVFSRDIIEIGIGDIPGEFDIITSFDSMEHWHHSPKKLFHEVVDKLRIGGIFVLSVPNCVNLRKRFTIPFGIGKWSTMKDWYEAEKFRGHVREPDINDLMYIARDMGLVDIRTYGRNWLGYYSESSAIRIATRILDFPLRLRASLCSNIYLVGRKT